jgi:C-terminal processing protease CtpA/Prc
LRERQDWVAAQMREWYLFPDTLPLGINPASYTSVNTFLDALTATARAQRKDRYFTYLTSIKEETAYYTSGSSAGFGWRLGLDSNARLYVTEAFEGASALSAGVDRGAEILAIGTSAADLRTVSSLYAAGGNVLSDAFGPDDSGTTRVFQIRDGSGTRTVSVTKTDFTLLPVSSRYGTKIITDGGQRYGYINLRTFIDTAEPALRAAFDQFRTAGITNIVVDLRYNGGGLVRTAELMNDLLGANRSTSEVMSYTTFRSEKASDNSTAFFAPQPQSIAPTRVAFIGTGGTASASELVINTFIPYLRNNAALIGTNTYGKPVGQIALDKPECDDRLRVVAFAIQNSARQGAYYDGLANTVEASCRAEDDLTYPMGDVREASTRSALDFLQGKVCTRITASASASAGIGAKAMSAPTVRVALTPSGSMSTAQHEVPGLF